MRYYPANGSSLSSLIDNLPSTPQFLEVAPSLHVDSITGKMGHSPFTSDTVLVLAGKYTAASSGIYSFSLSGGSIKRLFIDGILVSGPMSLASGTHTIEARFGVATLAELPIDVSLSVNGSVLQPIPTSNLRHDESSLLPFINSLPAGGKSSGGELITISGVGFFPANGVMVHWGATTILPSNLTVTPNTISFIKSCRHWN